MIDYSLMNRVLILMFLFLFSCAAYAQESPPLGLFVSMIEEPPVLSSRKGIDDLIQFATQAHVKVLFVQVYRANKSWFPSKVADSRIYKESLKSVGEDPLALLIQKAHAAGIEVHAWLNLLSLSKNTKAPILKKYGYGILTKNQEPKQSLKDYEIDYQYFLEPGDMRVRKVLSIMLGELLKKYPALDGVQFDYIRYPDVKPHYGYTAINMKRFKKAHPHQDIIEGSDIWKQWKKDQVTELLKMLVTKARKIHPHIHVSTTGCVSYSRAVEEAFQDWPFWINSGVVEFVTMMNYPLDVATFKQNNAGFKPKVSDFSKVHIALGAYKLIHLPQELEKQYNECRQSGAGGCSIFYYGSLLENPALKSFFLKQ